MVSLEKYNLKRNFSKTKEPKGKIVIAKGSQPIFVVQKHQASTLHYDFRLEIEGVLKSWAVPKGPSMEVGLRRLAVLTEDHPLSYASFEGEIPKGNYGAGKVQVWDKGIFSNLKSEDLIDLFDKGRLEINLKGKKLKGSFALIKTNKNWLLFKMKEKS